VVFLEAVLLLQGLFSSTFFWVPEAGATLAVVGFVVVEAVEVFGVWLGCWSPCVCALGVSWSCGWRLWWTHFLL